MPSRDTRLRLLRAAEKLFAERGIEGVSLREINIAAGQKNSGATHYHFGSKDGLIEAIFEYRHAGTYQRRRELADALDSDGMEGDPRRLVEALILPLAEQFTGSPAGSRYVRFLAQVHDEPQTRGFARFSSKVDDAQIEVERRLRRALAPLPRKIIDARMRLMADHVIHAFAARERRRRAQNDSPTALFVGNLIDVWVGALTAPVSPATQRELNSVRKAS